MEDKKATLLWKDNPETIKEFLEQTNDYKQLCEEIAYILKKKLNGNVEVSSVTSRCKTLKSFLEKLSRKEYKNPFSDITDFAGVRVVFLYQDDFPKIEKLISEEFEILEKVDKLNDKGSDKFGYGAIHFIVKIGKTSTGARYDDLKELVCEIQVRTVLQDAWAIIDHHLVYKRDSEIPTDLKRKLNGLAGLFDTADSQFVHVRKERENYLHDIKKSIDTPKFFDTEINLDTLNTYLEWKFKGRKLQTNSLETSQILDDIIRVGLKRISDIDKNVSLVIDKVLPDEEAIEKVLDDNLSAALLMDIALCTQVKNYYIPRSYSEGLQPIIENLRRKNGFN